MAQVTRPDALQQHLYANATRVYAQELLRLALTSRWHASDNNDMPAPVPGCWTPRRWQVLGACLCVCGWLCSALTGAPSARACSPLW